MSETVQTPPYTLGSDEKVASVMVYTANYMYWGEVVVKQMIRVSTWLRTNSAPDWFSLYNARAMPSMLTTPVKPVFFTELYVSVSQVMAYHLVPPAKDPPDYDPTEPNRKMQPATLLVGAFRVDGALRLSTMATVAKYLEIAREPFTGVYEAKITNMNMPNLGVISVPFLMARQETAIFTVP